MREPFLIGKGAPVFSFLGRHTREEEKRQRAVIQGWNECLDAVLKLLAEHKWVVEEDDPVDIFCDGCGESLVRALNGMRRRS